jgi:hypothetical protein
LSLTKPWTPHPPVWEWDGVASPIGDLSKEYFGKLADAIEQEAAQYRAVAEMRAYCAIVDVLHQSGVFTTEHLHGHDVIRQVARAESFRRNDAIGRCIMAGTWTKDLRGLASKDKREALISAAMAD